MRHRLSILFVCTGVFLGAEWPCCALAQTAAPAVPPAIEARERVRFGADWQLGSWLIADFETELELTEFALPRLHDAEVKSYAERAADDYRRLLAKLRPFGDLQEEAAAATNGAAPRPESNAATTVDVTSPAPAAPVTPRPAVPVAPSNVGGDGGAGAVVIAKMDGPGFDLVSLRRRLARQTADSAKRNWATLAGGAPFDRAYLQREISAHQALLDALTVFRTHASPQLQALIDEIAPIVQDRLTQAEALFNRTLAQ